MAPLWHIRLFNGPILVDASGRETRRFRSHKVGALLAYLALHLDSPCPRESLYEALWPEEEARLSANRFRVTLTSLRRHLEPDGVIFGSVVDVSQPGRVRLRAGVVVCDVAECERLLRAGRGEQAAALMAGPLLPGYYEEWAIAAQARYELLAEDLLAPLNGSPARHTSLPHTEPYHAARTTFPASPPSAASSLSLRDASLLDGGASQADAPSSSLPLSDFRSPVLPLYLTRFFGRRRERQMLRELIESHRLVSLIGMGGMGKTRLAVEVAQEWQGECRFLSLAPLGNASRLYDAALRCLDVAPQTDADMKEQLIHVLNRRGELLLILDNAEHLSEAVAEMALGLLARAPALRLLVTSRQRLNVAGEAVLPLTSLDAPDAPAQAERLLEFAAVSLFVDRAKNARPDFHFAERYIPALLEICRRLEGIPLALELAAARITSQTPQQIADSLQSGLTDLKARQHGLPPRHQSLRAVIQGSLDLLSMEQQAFFLALSVFSGGWTWEAAQAVTNCAQVGDYLEDLTRCSLVTAQEEERLEAMRYTLLEPLRQFAAQCLAPPQQDIYRERHARFFMSLAANADQEDFRFMDRMEADHENILLAMEWRWQHDRATLLPLLQGILNMWANRGRHRLALEWIARYHAERALLARQYKSGMFTVYVDVGRYEDAEELIRLVEQEAATPIHTASVNMGRGYICMMRGVWNEAVMLQRRAIAAAYEIEGEQRDLVIRLASSNVALALLGRAAYLTDSPNSMEHAARSSMKYSKENSVEDCREAECHLRSGYATLPPDSRLEAAYHWHLMCALYGQSRFEEGDARFASALETALAHRHWQMLMKIMGDGAFRLAVKGYAAESVQMFSAEQTLREKMGYRLPVYQEARNREHLRALQEALGREAFDRCWQSGLYTPPDTLIPAILPQVLLRKNA